MSDVGIVLGGSGFIGLHLLRHLLVSRRHEKIVSIDIKAPREKLAGVDYYELDLTSSIPVTLGHPRSTIYNLAAIRDFPGHEHSEYYDVNVGTTIRCIEFAEKTQADTIVFTSTMSIYGPGEDPKTEDSPLLPVNPYGNSKRICEILYQDWLGRVDGRKLVICRPAVIFGHYDRGNYTRLAKALRHGYFFFVGRRDTVKSAGYVGDLVESFSFCLEKSSRLITYNFAYPKAYTISEIVNCFTLVGGFRAPRVALPSFLLELLAIPFEILDRLGLRNPIHRDRIKKLYQSTHIVPRWLVENGFEFKTDLRKALEEWQADTNGEFL